MLVRSDVLCFNLGEPETNYGSDEFSDIILPPDHFILDAAAIVLLSCYGGRKYPGPNIITMTTDYNSIIV